MKRFVTMLTAAALLTACFDDPTSDLRGDASRIRLSRSVAFLNPGTSVVVDATLLDRQGNTVPGIVSFATVDATVATAADTDTLPGQTESVGEITGVAAGQTYVRATGGGVTDSIRVVVVPTEFAGSVSPATGNVGTIVTATVPTGLTFDTSAVAVLVDGAEVIMVSKSSTSVSFIPPATTDGVLSLSGLVLLGAINLPALDASTALAITEPNEPANDGPGGGAAISLAAAVGDSVVVFGSLYGEGYAHASPGNDPDDFFTITTTTADSLEIRLEWANDAIDVDAYMLNSGGGGFCVLDGCSAATGNMPEFIRVRLGASTSYQLYINLWDNTEAAGLAYRIVIYKRG